MNTNDAKEYLSRREIPQLFESLLTGLMYYRPDDPIDYLETCLKKVRELGGTDKVRWDTFVGQEKKSLPPLNGGQSRRSFFRNVLPDSPNFPYRRYERLPPINQFSIESDSDLSETAELIEEYEVFDPSNPRPKVILIIGGPGSGKGTQCLKIAERYGFEYVSVGELLRKKMIHNATSNRKWSLIARIITNGELAPQETTITEIKQKIMKIPEASGIVIDGFPRDVGQALSFEDQVSILKVVAEQTGQNPTRAEQKTSTANALLFIQLDADRDEEEVFCDISMTVDNKMYPTKEPVAGPSELDLSLLADGSSLADVPTKFDEQTDEEVAGYAEATGESECSISQVIFVCGPGSGKALQSEKIEERYSLKRLCPGDILCSELQSHSERGRFLRDLLERGEQLPEDTLLDLLCEAMTSTVRQGKGFLVTDFPKNVKQAQEYEAKMGQPDIALFLECSADIMSRRLQRRATCSLHTKEARDRDTRRRVDGFCSLVNPLVSHYEHREALHKIDAEQPPEDVFEQICLVLDSC
uniref:Adenylate kinase 5 n=1 Tax=Sinocyclocheilus rhinocerous TaxID=307959 RepID=A0A673GRR0_9TELE